MSKGLKEFGEKGVEAVMKEIQQLHDREVIIPVETSELSREEKKAALAYLMFLTKKRCGRIRGRGCADGRKQRTTTKKEDASSPTVSIESVMISCTIDAEERRDVGCIDLPCAFMQSKMEDLVQLQLQGKMAELICRLDPALYSKYITNENGKSVIYV